MTNNGTIQQQQQQQPKDILQTTTSNNTPNSSQYYYHHTSIVLFYKYFIPIQRYPIFHQYATTYYVLKLQNYLNDICTKYQLKGRILLSYEGINGTVSASSEGILQQYITDMKQFNLLTDIPYPPDLFSEEDRIRKDNTSPGEYLFENIDWKISSNNKEDKNGSEQQQKQIIRNPFPDMKISIVNEVISTGGTVEAEEIIEYGGIHLSPTEFHTALSNTTNNNKKDIILIDVRNTFEHDIGYFINPNDNNEPALNPETITFSSFDDIFVKKHVDEWKNKDIYMYCTGGIRCEKASVMVKKQLLLRQKDNADNNNTPPNVYQLQGGIHRYIEQYGSNGYFKGLNFVFDQRVVQKPSSYNNNNKKSSNKNNNTEEGSQQQQQQQQEGGGDNNNDNSNTGNYSLSSSTTPTSSCVKSTDVVVGKCIECYNPYDELCGSRICTVCRDLVLICITCQKQLYEYHCSKHTNFKTCYFTFLDTYTIDELQNQIDELQLLHKTKYAKGHEYRNIRKTITKQITKIQNQIEYLQNNGGDVIPCRNKENPTRRCRTCMEVSSICNGRCWGFWKSMPPVSSEEIQSIPPITVGDVVEPGPNWNVFKLGSRFNTTPSSSNELNIDDNNNQRDGQQLLRGRVVEVKAVWSYGGADVAVSWNNNENYNNNNNNNNSRPSDVVVTDEKKDENNGNCSVERSRKYYPSIYRWGILATNGQRMYDLQHVVYEYQ